MGRSAFRAEGSVVAFGRVLVGALPSEPQLRSLSRITEGLVEGTNSQRHAQSVREGALPRAEGVADSILIQRTHGKLSKVTQMLRHASTPATQITLKG